MNEKLNIKIIRVVWILLLSLISAMLLLELVYLIPTSLMMDNIISSNTIFQNEGLYPNIAVNIYGKTGILDNFTDSLMIGTAGFDSGASSVLEKALLNQRCGFSIESITNLILGDSSNIIEYSRYWHGYLIFLKPLLLVMDYNGIRILNFVLQLILIISIVVVMFRNCKKLLIPYLISLFVLNPYLVSLSMQFSAIYYISNLSVLILLLFYQKLKEKNNFIYLFLITGILTSFFDLLTYPLTTLLMPLVTVLYLKKNDNENLKDKIKFIIKMCIYWAIGYFVFWILKWMVVAIFVDNTILENVISNFKFRTFGDAVEGINKYEQLTCFKGLAEYLIFNVKNLSIILVLAIALIFTILIKKLKYNNKLNFTKNNIVPYLLISLIPICWFIVFSNHSFIHSFFTYRTYVGLVYSLSVMLLLFFEQKENVNIINSEIDSLSESDNQNGRTIAVLIPCYNEHLTIKRTIERYKSALPEATIYVYDNNSVDNSDVIAKEAGAVVVYEKKQGKGNVVRSMFKDIDADCYFMVDADDTYMADNAREMCDLVLDGKADMVIGDRLSSTYFTEEKRKSHTFGNKLVRFLINKLYKTKIKDIMTGQRSFSKRFVKSFECKSNGFEIETEMTIFACDENMVVKELPVNYIDRQEGSFSKLNTYKDGFKVLMTILKMYLKRHFGKFISICSILFLALGLGFFVPAILGSGICRNLLSISIFSFVILYAGGLISQNLINKKCLNKR